MDKQKLLDYLENEIRTYWELGTDFYERYAELVALRTLVESGEFDAT